MSCDSICRYIEFLARSKMTTQYFDSRLATTVTVRNWRTVNKLLDMATEA